MQHRKKQVTLDFLSKLVAQLRDKEEQKPLKALSPCPSHPLGQAPWPPGHSSKVSVRSLHTARYCTLLCVFVIKNAYVQNGLALFILNLMRKFDLVCDQLAS